MNYKFATFNEVRNLILDFIGEKVLWSIIDLVGCNKVDVSIKNLIEDYSNPSETMFSRAIMRTLENIIPKSICNQKQKKILLKELLK